MRCIRPRIEPKKGSLVGDEAPGTRRRILGPRMIPLATAAPACRASSSPRRSEPCLPASRSARSPRATVTLTGMRYRMSSVNNDIQPVVVPGVEERGLVREETTDLIVAWRHQRRQLWSRVSGRPVHRRFGAMSPAVVGRPDATGCSAAAPVQRLGPATQQGPLVVLAIADMGLARPWPIRPSAACRVPPCGPMPMVESSSI